VAVNIIGTIVLIVVPPNESTKVGLLICFYFMQCMQSTSPSIWSLLSVSFGLRDLMTTRLPSA
jgi:hypothetical protein